MWPRERAADFRRRAKVRVDMRRMYPSEETISPYPRMAHRSWMAWFVSLARRIGQGVEGLRRRWRSR